jgi:hypothetical protein
VRRAAGGYQARSATATHRKLNLFPIADQETANVTARESRARRTRDADEAERYGWANRALLGADLDAFVAATNYLTCRAR